MGKRILIVDDEPSIVVSLEWLMRHEGFETLVAGDGEAALAAVERSAPDLVILDVMLPAMNGFEVCQRIRSDPRFDGVKILILSAKGRDSEVARGVALGADAYVTKPFSTKDLVAQIKQMVGGS